MHKLAQYWVRRMLANFTSMGEDKASADACLNSLFPNTSEQDEILANRFLREGIIQIAGFDAIPIDDDIWNCGPQNTRHWKWKLHSFSVLDSLIATGEWEAVDALIRSWRARFESVSIDDDFPWHDHATALRLDRLSRLAIAQPQLRYPSLAADHATLLLEDFFYSENTNHGFDQAVSLVLASLAFSDHRDAKRWCKTGVQRLKNEMRVAFTDEGVHVENSPLYHMDMLANMVRAHKVLEAAEAGITKNFDEFYNNALGFTAWMTRPDGLLTYLGDTSAVRPTASAELADFPNYSAMRWASTGGQDGTPLEQTSAIYPESGYAIYRSHWRPWSMQTHIVMKCGALSRYHRQDDDLNVLLHAHGEDWLIDSGLYNYHETDPMRVYMRSALAHNIPYLEGHNTNRDPSTDGATSLKQLDEPESELAVAGHSQMYKGAKIYRKLVIKNKNQFSIFDRIHAPETTRRYWIFHLPSDKKITLSPGLVTVRGRNEILKIRSTDKNLESIVFRGQSDDFPSFFSNSQNSTLR